VGRQVLEHVRKPSGVYHLQRMPMLKHATFPLMLLECTAAQLSRPCHHKDL
jgi:hypothetical protein